MIDSKPASSYSTRGGARIGWVNYSWPLASLSVDASSLTITTTFFGLFEMGRYSFRPDQVAHLGKYGWLPVLGEGIRVQHTVANYPGKVVFWCRPSAVLQGIASTGFHGTSESTAPLGSLPSRGFPLRIWPLVVILMLWNLLFGYEFFSQPRPVASPAHAPSPRSRWSLSPPWPSCFHPQCRPFFFVPVGASLKFVPFSCSQP